MGDLDEWKQRAACRDFPTALFFPAEHDDDQTDGDELIAKQICASCWVQSECKAAQIEEPYGIRGRMSAEERGYGTRGRLGKNTVGNLSETVLDILRAHPDDEFTTDDMNAAILAESGRRWPRNSVNAALLRSWRSGRTTRRRTDESLLTYRYNKESV